MIQSKDYYTQSSNFQEILSSIQKRYRHVRTYQATTAMHIPLVISYIKTQYPKLTKISVYQRNTKTNAFKLATTHQKTYDVVSALSKHLGNKHIVKTPRVILAEYYMRDTVAVIYTDKELIVIEAHT